MTFGTTIIVEDDEAIRESLEDVCRDILSIHPLTAASAAEAVPLILAHLPAVVLLDLTLPDEDGSWVVARVNAEGVENDVRFVVLSAQTYVGQKASNLGAYAFLAKPFSLAAVVEVLEQAGAR